MTRTHKRVCAALYLRLSKDDEGAGESVSIGNQRLLLRAYAEEHGFEVVDEYVDDGYSGTDFERPAFQRLLLDVEAQRVNTLLIKDLSRLGRDYILTGHYLEVYFPRHRVRVIAVNDGYDSESAHNDLAPFQNIVNEMYARDVSKKIRSAFVANMRAGAFVGAFAPYGYRRDPTDRHRLVVDEDAAWVVQEIFSRISLGETPIAIVRDLNARGVPSPLAYRQLKRFSADGCEDFRCCGWSSAGVTRLLHDRVYLGHTVQGKTRRLSFKSRVSVKKAKEEWIEVKHTHVPLVSEEVFLLAEKRSHQRLLRGDGTFHNVFSGIAVCADCGSGMSTVVSRKKGAVANLACGGYKRGGRAACTNHFIDYETLSRLVLETMRQVTVLTEEEQSLLLRRLEQVQGERLEAEQRREREGELCKRLHRLELLIERLYEDRVAERLDEAHMQRMLEKYRGESQRAKTALEELRRQATVCADRQSLDRWRQMIGTLIPADRLDVGLLSRLIERIEIAQGDYVSDGRGRHKVQTIRIFFRFSEKSKVCSSE